MHETQGDLDELQAVIDRSYASAGEHLLSIHTPVRRMTAEQVADRLQGMCLLSLATVSADGRPIVGPVDISADEGAGFRQTLLEIYTPRYGADWEEFLDSGPVYARIEAERMFTFHAPSA